MSEPGLHASIWASKTDEDTQHGPRPGDWKCPACGFSNFQRRTECFRCSFKGLKEASANGYQQLNTTPNDHNAKTHRGSGSWDEAGCASSKGSMWQKEDSTWTGPQDNTVEPGLAMSRWAPRNYSGGSKASHTREVWTRTVPASKSGSTPMTTTPPDLGLPYEVQHFILATIQRILEEGCYDFAFRWIPNILMEKNWTCSEAVELATWKKFLPEEIPYKAISSMPTYSLEKALADAVFIRNAAVHRHLCNNVELCRMATQAQDLMFMFSDVTRQNKFYQLREELKQWDSVVIDNPQLKRDKLESALREISERPVNDMDWTPNEVSLQEITSSPESYRIPTPEDYLDQMEID